MATRKEQEELFDKIMRIKSYIQSLGSSIQNELPNHRFEKDWLDDAIEDFDHDFEIVKQALIKVKQEFHQYITDYKKNGYKSVPNDQPKPLVGKNTFSKDLYNASCIDLDVFQSFRGRFTVLAFYKRF